MKTKILAVTVATILGAGAYMHSGDKPRCLLHLFASKKTEVKAQPALATNANDANEKKKKNDQLKDQHSKSHEKYAR